MLLESQVAPSSSHIEGLGKMFHPPSSMPQNAGSLSEPRISVDCRLGWWKKGRKIDSRHWRSRKLAYCTAQLEGDRWLACSSSDWFHMVCHCPPGFVQLYVQGCERTLDSSRIWIEPGYCCTVPSWFPCMHLDHAPLHEQLLWIHSVHWPQHQISCQCNLEPLKESLESDEGLQGEAGFF